MQLSKKKKLFFEPVSSFLKATLFPKMRTLKKVVKEIFKKSPFRRSFGN